MLGVLVGKYYWILPLFFCSSPKHLLLSTSKATEYRELFLVWSSMTMLGYWFFQPLTTCYNISKISQYFGKNSLWTYGNSQLNFFFLFLFSPLDKNSVKSSCKLIPLPSLIEFAFVSASAWANVFACVARVQQLRACVSISSDGRCVQAFRSTVSQIL